MPWDDDNLNRNPPMTPFGAMKGEFDLQDDWNKALSDEEADAFWEGQW
jgi:hypothetical protein